MIEIFNDLDLQPQQRPVCLYLITFNWIDSFIGFTEMYFCMQSWTSLDHY